MAVSDRQVPDDSVSVAAPVTRGQEVVAASSVVAAGGSAAALRPYASGVRAALRGISRVLDQGDPQER